MSHGPLVMAHESLAMTGPVSGMLGARFEARPKWVCEGARGCARLPEIRRILLDARLGARLAARMRAGARPVRSISSVNFFQGKEQKADGTFQSGRTFLPSPARKWSDISLISLSGRPSGLTASLCIPRPNHRRPSKNGGCAPPPTFAHPPAHPAHPPEPIHALITGYAPLRSHTHSRTRA
jgi:hypothetical protein